jgi:hypothetical protein
MATIRNIKPNFTAQPGAYPEGKYGVLHVSEMWNNMPNFVPVAKFICKAFTSDEFVNINMLKSSVYL